MTPPGKGGGHPPPRKLLGPADRWGGLPRAAAKRATVRDDMGGTPRTPGKEKKKRVRIKKASKLVFFTEPGTQRDPDG